jgi:hypothetical protein
MPNVCQNEACGLSFRSGNARRVRELVGVIRGRQDRGEAFEDLVGQLTPALVVLQNNDFCRECRGLLLRVTQPTIGLNGDDLARAVEKNNLLIAGYELQALGILPFD